VSDSQLVVIDVEEGVGKTGDVQKMPLEQIHAIDARDGHSPPKISRREFPELRHSVLRLSSTSTGTLIKENTLRDPLVLHVWLTSTQMCLVSWS